VAGPQHPEFRFVDGDVVTVSNRDAVRLIAAMQTLANDVSAEEQWIPYATAIARVEAATELHGTAVVNLYPAEDTAVLRALDTIESNPAPKSALGRLRRALVTNGAENT